MRPTKTQIERRVIASEVEARTAGENRRIIVGYAYKFGSRSQNLGGFREQVMEGAGAESVERDDIRALMNHDPNLILGRNRAGTLRLAEDSTGLHYEIAADERQSYVRDLLIALERGDVTQSSFAFIVHPDGERWSLDEDDFPLRTLLRFSLLDVSPVTYPAYLASEASVSERALTTARAMAGPGITIPDTPEFDETQIRLRGRIAQLRLRG